MPLRIAIVCSNNLFSEGLKSLLEDESDNKVVGIFNEGPEALSTFREILKLNPDVIIADFSDQINLFLSLPDDILSQNMKIILIGSRTLKLTADSVLRELINKGVVGILPPSADFSLLKKVVKAVSEGDLWVDRTILMKIMSSMKNHGPNITLAKREKEIVSHICQGYRNKEIAQKLNISEQTVKSHCSRIYKKLGVSDRLQLALYSFHNIEK